MELFKNPMPRHPKLSPLQILLLLQLDFSPKYGYELLKTIKDEFAGIWEPKTGTIYPALKSLEKKNLVRIQIQEGVDFYYITPQGRELLLHMSLIPTMNIKFMTKFIETVTKWMSPQLKRDIIVNMSLLPEIEMSMLPTVKNFLNEDIDRDTRLKIMCHIRTDFEERLAELNKMITEVEGLN
jgi:DNA-binding PadR family transcriptional regulator